MLQKSVLEKVQVFQKKTIIAEADTKGDLKP